MRIMTEMGIGRRGRETRHRPRRPWTVRVPYDLRPALLMIEIHGGGRWNPGCVGAEHHGGDVASISGAGDKGDARQARPAFSLRDRRGPLEADRRHAGRLWRRRGTSPTPGVFGRAAFGSCLVIGYAMWAARLEIPIESLEVEVHSDFDARGELGVSADVRPGHTAIRYIVRMTSDASGRSIAGSILRTRTVRGATISSIRCRWCVKFRSPLRIGLSHDGRRRSAPNSAVRVGSRGRSLRAAVVVATEAGTGSADRVVAAKPGARVLEISCGTGLSHGRWQPLSAAGVFATDISERMVERTANEATRRGLTQVTCRRVDAEAIDEPDGTFDAVVCALGLMYVPEAAMASVRCIAC